MTYYVPGIVFGARCSNILMKHKILEKADYKNNQIEYWTAWRSNQSILKEISPEYLLEGLMLKLKLQYFGHLIRRTDSFERPWCWERLKVRGEGDDRGWDGWMASPTQWTWVWVNSGSWWRTRKPRVLYVVHGVAKNRTRLSGWTELNWTMSSPGVLWL